MKGTLIDGGIELNRGRYHYSIDMKGKVITIRASIGAMIVLQRELKMFSGNNVTLNALPDVVKALRMSLKWKFGPLRLNIVTPSGPGLLYRVMNM
jgi:hypothetical protein